MQIDTHNTEWLIRGPFDASRQGVWTLANLNVRASMQTECALEPWKEKEIWSGKEQDHLGRSDQLVRLWFAGNEKKVHLDRTV